MLIWDDLCHQTRAIRCHYKYPVGATPLERHQSHQKTSFRHQRDRCYGYRPCAIFRPACNFFCTKSCTCWEAAKELPKIVRHPRFWYGFVKVASCEGLGVCWGGYLEIRRNLCCCGKANFENLEEKLREYLGGFYRNGSTSTSCLNHSFWDVRLFQTGKMQRTLSWRSSWKSWRATNGSRFCRSDIALLRFCNVLATQRGNTQGFRRLKTYCITLLWYCIHLYPNHRPIFGSKKILGKSDSCHPSVHWSIDPTRREKNALQEQPRLQQILVIDGSMTPMDSHGVPGGCWLLPVD